MPLKRIHDSCNISNSIYFDLSQGYCNGVDSTCSIPLVLLCTEKNSCIFA